MDSVVVKNSPLARPWGHTCPSRSGGDPRRQPSVQTGACDERLVSRGPLDGDSTSVGAAHAPAVSWTGGSGNGKYTRVNGLPTNWWGTDTS